MTPDDASRGRLGRPSRFAASPRWQSLALALLCAAIYWPGLGSAGFSSSEGHRVVPAWEMLESGDYLVPRMFGQAYLRKPPGMPWAIALSSSLLGETEFGARAVSALAATLGALLAFAFATRWFGSPWGLAAGVVHALTPLFWPSGRSAEIEALNNLATQASVLLLLELLVVRRGRGRGAELWLGALAGIAIATAALAKGPAGLPCFGAAVLAACLVNGSTRALRRPALGVALLIPAAALGAIGLAITHRLGVSGETPVVQTPGEFLWDPDRLARTLLLAPTALVYALPGSLALLFPWGPDARREAARRAAAGGEPGERDARAFQLTRALTFTCLLSLLFFTLIGVSNPRYTLPAVSFIAPVAAYVVKGWATDFMPKRKLIARACMLGGPRIFTAVSLLGAGAWIGWYEHDRGVTSGDAAGARLAGWLPDGAQVWANGLIEARPEVLLYAERRAGRDGRHVQVRWAIPDDDLASPPVPAPGGYLLLRTDELSGEIVPYQAAGVLRDLRITTADRVYKYTYTLFQVVEDPRGRDELSSSTGHPSTEP